MSLKKNSLRRPANRKLGMEHLESRKFLSASSVITVPAAELEDLSSQESAEVRSLRSCYGKGSASAVCTGPYIDANGTLVIPGTSGNDDVSVVANEGAQATVYQKVNGKLVVHQKFNSVRSITFMAGDGNNTFNNNTSLPSKAVGGSGVDYFHGGSGSDTFYGMGGDDRLMGMAGSDQLFGGTGSDTLEAGETGESGTHNILKGGQGVDYLYGSGGLDDLYGGKGGDYLEDIAGNGRLYGGAGNDILKGTDVGVMEMHGGDGNDQLWHRSSIGKYTRWGGDDYRR